MRKTYKGFLALLVTLALLTGCSAKDLKIEETPTTQMPSEESSSSTAKVEDHQLIIAMSSPDTLNPLYSSEASVQQALYLMFSPLVNIEEDGTISASIAKSWMVNESSTAVTITLRDGIKWHDGTPLSVDDVLFTIEQIKSIPDSPYKVAVENIASVEKVDATTFKMMYKQAFSGLLQTLFFPIIPKHIYDVPENNSLAITPIGSGPYVFKSITPLKSIDLEANQAYFNGAPQIKDIQITLIPDEESRLYAFKQGLIDVVYTPITEWGKYTSDKASNAYEMTSNIYEFMGLNLNKTMFQNANVRQALLYALDRQNMVHLYYLDHAVVTDSPISPTSYLFDKTLEIKTYDKEKARLLLTQEGYEKDSTTGLMVKNGVPFSFTLIVNTENRDRVKIAYEMQKSYKDLGIEMTVEELDQETYLSRITSKQYDAFLGGWQLSYAVDLSFALHSSSILSGQNYVSYKDETMDELLQQAFLATSGNINEAYNKLQQHFVAENPYISLYFKKSVLITSNKIKGDLSPTPLNIFANIEKWTLI